MSVWMVRAGKHGETENVALEHNVVAIGWDELPDLSGVKSRDDLRRLMEKHYPDSPVARISNWLGQVWSFKDRIQEGDLVVLPLKNRSAIAVGEIKGPYEYQSKYPEGGRHTRKVRWIRKDIPRSTVQQDLLYTLGAFLTVCKVERNNAEERVKALLKGERPTTDPQEPVEEIDIEQHAQDQIRNFIGTKYKGHDLTRLVAEVLRAQKYHTFTSTPGPDGGVDVLAGSGPMGFHSPKLCVQVKSGDGPVDVGVLRELQGVMKNFGAEQGLLVAWGGFKDSVYKEARTLYFEIRLWDADQLVAALLENYDALSDDIQAELPLKRVWTLVPESKEA